MVLAGRPYPRAPPRSPPLAIRVGRRPGSAYWRESFYDSPGNSRLANRPASAA